MVINDSDIQREKERRLDQAKLMKATLSAKIIAQMDKLKKKNGKPYKALQRQLDKVNKIDFKPRQ